MDPDSLSRIWIRTRIQHFKWIQIGFCTRIFMIKNWKKNSRKCFFSFFFDQKLQFTCHLAFFFSRPSQRRSLQPSIVLMDPDPDPIRIRIPYPQTCFKGIDCNQTEWWKVWDSDSHAIFPTTYPLNSLFILYGTVLWMRMLLNLLRCLVLYLQQWMFCFLI